MILKQKKHVEKHVDSHLLCPHRGDGHGESEECEEMHVDCALMRLDEICRRGVPGSSDYDNVIIKKKNVYTETNLRYLPSVYRIGTYLYGF